MPPAPLRLTRERKLKRCGHGSVAGLDEVGRGPLAGPVVAAAVVLDMKRVPVGLADSKMLTRERREELFLEILATAEVGIGSLSAAEIDRINIRQATLLAMCRALEALPCPVHTIVKGDAHVPSIAAASIVAKVVRDRMMRRLGELYPAYGFGSNVGYSTGTHLSALSEAGPCAFHRRSFAPVRAASLTLETL